MSWHVLTRIINTILGHDPSLQSDLELVVQSEDYHGSNGGCLGRCCRHQRDHHQLT